MAKLEAGGADGVGGEVEGVEEGGPVVGPSDESGSLGMNVEGEIKLAFLFQE